MIVAHKIHEDVYSAYFPAFLLVLLLVFITVVFIIAVFIILFLTFNL